MSSVQPYYTKTAKSLHWLMALLIIPLLLLGEHTMGSHGGRFLPSLHASAGFVLLVMLGARWYWRWKYPPPPPLSQSKVEIVVAKMAHLSLYAAMVLIPLTGWLAYTEHVRRTLGMRPASLFGLKIPLLPDFGINWHFIHNWGGKLTLLLIAFHVLVAMKHHFHDGDETLARMLPQAMVKRGKRPKEV
jgi:cytochrome b561